MSSIQIAYSPRTWQVDFHNNVNKYRFGVLLIHRRGGKTVAVLNELIKQAATCEHKAPRVAYICPQKDQAKRNAWDYLLEYVRPIEGVKISVSELTIQLPNGATIFVAGCDNPDSLRGAYFDFVVIDEASDVEDENVWYSVIRPMLADRVGKAIICGTVKGERFLWQMYERAKEDDKEWFTMALCPDDTNAIPPAEWEYIKKSTPYDVLQQEYFNNPHAAIKGAYFGETLNDLRRSKSICHVPYLAGHPVVAGWDLGGKEDSICVWMMQYINGEYHLIDFLKANSPTSETAVCKELMRKRYTFTQFYIPHDGALHVKSEGYRTKKQIIEDLTGVKCKQLPRPVNTESIDAGIRATDLFLSRCKIDSVRCAEGIRDISLYAPTYDPRAGVFAQRPKRSKYEDAADALRCLATGFKPNQNTNRAVAKGAYDPYNVSYNVDSNYDIFK